MDSIIDTTNDIVNTPEPNTTTNIVNAPDVKKKEVEKRKKILIL